MAIQLSERDNLIFKFIEEHQVLLEKHIAWFISCDDKPVLIRDRLRKLFYLDYLLCERHGGKLPWWTTPTKPLVYMLSPMTRQLQRAGDSPVDLSNCDNQRHLLEIANLRMLFLMEQKEGLIGRVQWTTNRKSVIAEASVDATISFTRNGVDHTAAIINHPVVDKAGIVKAAEASDCGIIWIISRDDAHQQSLQQAFLQSSIASKVAFATHQELYKSGIVKAKWQGVSGQYASILSESVIDITGDVALGRITPPIQAVS